VINQAMQITTAVVIDFVVARTRRSGVSRGKSTTR